MSSHRLDASDKKVLVLWILAAVIGAGVAYKYFFRAFPEASVEFAVPRNEALDRAREFAAAQGAALEGYDSTIVFDVDETAKTFLEREAGLEQANRLMAGEVHVWSWRTRFFRPLQKEEFGVRVDPGGAIIGYSHVLEETAPGARPEQAAAQATAESFLTGVVRVDLSGYEFLAQEANFTERPNRRDWGFTWERRGFSAQGAPYQLRVTLAGERVSGYREFLKVPEAWQLDYERLRSTNNLFAYIALIPYAFLLGACLQVIFALGRRGLLDWRGGLALALFLGVLYFAMSMNQWPLDRASYDTNTPYSSFFLSHVGQAVLTSIFSAVMVMLAFVPGEPLYRATQPGHVRIAAMLRPSGLATKEFFMACTIGICLAAAHIGFITVFYIVSGKLGGWAPQDLNYTNVVSTALPWLYPLTIGIYAATSEEFLFRLFAIPFLLRTTRSKFLAVVLPAFAWGFLHSNYPQQPAYIRGIEVGLIGVVAGLVMLRWGIVATLVWHYTVDAFLIGTSLLRSSGAYLPISGAIIGGAAVIVLAITGMWYLSRKKFEDDPALLNAAAPISPGIGTGETETGEMEALEIAAGETAGDERATNACPGADERAAYGQSAATRDVSADDAATPAYGAMPLHALAVLGILAAVGAALLLWVRPVAIGDLVRFEINSSQAQQRAGQVLRERGIDPAGYHRAATITYTFDSYTNEYLRRTIGIAAANRVYQTQVPSAFWTVRYFRDSQNEQYVVVLKPDGALHSVRHTLEESAPGANLTKPEAQARAESYLLEAKMLDLSAWNLMDAAADKQPARTDHLFVWEAKEPLDTAPAGEGARVRMEVRVSGDEISAYRTFIKIPEAWRDAESRTTITQTVQSFAGAALLIGVVLTILVVLVRSLKHPEIARVPWSRIAKWSVWVLAGAVVTFANRAPQFLAAYTPAWPLTTYYFVIMISLIFLTALYLAGAFLLLGVGWFFLQRAFPRTPLPRWIGMPAPYYRDAFCIAALGTVALAGLTRVPYLFARWPLMQHALDADVPPRLDALLPATSAMADSVWTGFFATGLIALAAGLVATYVRAAWMKGALAVLLAIITTTNTTTPGAFVRGVILRLLFIGLVWFGVARIARFNLMGYFLLAAMLVLVPAAVELLGQPNGYFRANGYAVAAFSLALLIWPMALWRRSASSAQRPA